MRIRSFYSKIKVGRQVLLCTLLFLMNGINKAFAQEFEEFEEYEEISKFADKEHLGIYFNERVGDFNKHIQENEMLTLFYLYNSKMRKDLDGKDWSILDDIFLKVLNEL